MIGFNGGLIGKKNTYVGTGSNPGLWTLNERTVGISGISATGGTVTTASVGGGNYRVHVFNASADFIVQIGGTVEYLVIAGGGSGGSANNTANSEGGGGGGAGGFLTGLLTVTSQTYPITVGAGGAATSGTLQNGNNGGNSVFSSILSLIHI